jgi:glycerol-3-phosphate acyltransferase PlsY
MPVIFTAFILACYLFGAIPFMLLIGRMKGRDLSKEPDLHHALWYGLGRGWGMLGFLSDVLKGVLPPLAGFLSGFPLWVSGAGALAALCGQMWPVFRKFDGERGNSVGTGIVFTFCLCYDAVPTLLIALGFVFIGLIVRTAVRWKGSGSNLRERIRLGGPQSLVFPLGVILGFASCPITSWLWGKPPELTFTFLGLLLLILARRLTAGLSADLKGSPRPAQVIVNRLLFDRSER